MITKQTPKEEIIKKGNKCNNCGRCCMNGSGFLIDEDFVNISSFLGIPQKELKEKYLDKVILYGKEMHRPKTRKKPYGPCIFLEGKDCSIHEVKPFMCRIATCSDEGKDIIDWFMLNYVVELNRTSIREWKSKLSVSKTIKGGSIEELIPDEKLRKSLVG